MASSVSRAALPSGRALRLGSERLPLPALRAHGHGAAVLAVRRNGTGRRGVLMLAVDELKGPFNLRSAWAVKATSAQSDDLSGADAEVVVLTDDLKGADAEFKLVRELREKMDRNMTKTSSFGVMLVDEGFFLPKNNQVMLAGYANSSFALWTDVTNRLRPPTESRVYEGLRLCGEILIGAAVSCSKCRGTWKNVSDVVEALELLRRLVSSTLEAPLPHDWMLRWDASLPVDYNDAEMGLTFILQRTFVLVKRDIDSMRTFVPVERDIESMLHDAN